MKILKKVKYYFLALLLPLIICCIILYSKNIFSNIENFFVTDLKMQHFSFLNYMKNVLLGKVSIDYSFSAGMGSPMLATMIFYAISPVNLLLLLIKDIQYAILFIYICKICLASLSMYILLKSKTKKESITTIVFSTSYALCAFAINYFFCIFWFDCLYLAPLVMYGIDKIFEKNKISLVYIVSLALTIICNIQMGFGLCIYSVIYFLYSLSMKYNIKEDMKKIKTPLLIFFISSLCAGAISSGALLGFIAEYDKISAARGIINLNINTSNIGLALKNLFTVGNLKGDYFNDFEPFIYSGLITSFFSMIYLFGSHDKKEKRYPALLVVLIFIISFSIKTINLFWHISNPVLLNFRYSIYLTAFLTMIAYQEYSQKNKLVKKDINVLVAFTLIGLFMIIAYTGEIYTGYTFIFLILIALGIYLTKNKSKKFEIPLLIIVIIEIIINGHLSIYGPSELVYDRYTSYKNLNRLEKKYNLKEDNRVIYNYSYLENTNETLLLNKNSSPRYFSSVIDGNLISFFNRNMSKVGNNNYQLSVYDSPLLLSLIGNKYFYLIKEYNNSIYKKIDTYKIKDFDYNLGKQDEKEIYLYENPYALSIGYMINKDSKFKSTFDVVDYQNQMMKDFTGIDEDIMIELNFTRENESDLCNEEYNEECQLFRINNDSNNHLVYIYGPWSVYNTNNTTNVYYDTNEPLLLSTLNRNIDIALYYNGIEKEKFVMATYNEEKLINGLSKLQENMLENIKINRNIMTGEINSKKDGILLLTIPYEKKFNIYVDDKKTKVFPTLDDTFMGINLKKGEHKIKIEYKDNSLIYYAIASLFSLIITIIITYTINRKLEIKRQILINEEQQKEKRKAKKIEKEKVSNTQSTKNKNKKKKRK